MDVWGLVIGCLICIIAIIIEMLFDIHSIITVVPLAIITITIMYFFL